MYLTRLFFVVLPVVGLLGCPNENAEESATLGMTSTTTSPTTDPETQTSTGAPCQENDQACLDYCLNYIDKAPQCLHADENCFDLCQTRLRVDQEYYGCNEEMRSQLRCEAQVAMFDEPFCQSLECYNEHLDFDLCRGFCTSLGGRPSSSSGINGCSWKSQCYAGTVEMTCPKGQNPVCSCLVDDVEVATCELGTPLDNNLCDELHVLKGCCRDVFLETLGSDTSGGEESSGDEPGSGSCPVGNPVGEPCPLVGMYLACEAAGEFAFCDQLGGTPVYGPCVVPECSLAGASFPYPCEECSTGYCYGNCELIDAVPTTVKIGCSQVRSTMQPGPPYYPSDDARNGSP